MNSDLELILTRLRYLSVPELLSVQEALTSEIRQKTRVFMSHSWADLPSRYLTGEAYLFSPQEIEADLSEVFTREELAEIERTVLSNLPQGKKPTTERLGENLAR